MGEDRSQTSRRRVTVAEASEILGVTVEAVRGRIKRGTLDHERDSGAVYVLLDADQPSTGHQPDDDQATDQSRLAAREEIEDELRDRIRYLERQVEEEREARRRADLLLSQLMDRVPQLEAPREAPEAPETAEEEPERAEPLIVTILYTLFPLGDLYAGLLSSMLWDAAKTAHARLGREGSQATFYVHKVDKEGRILKAVGGQTRDPEIIKDLIRRADEEGEDDNFHLPI